MSEQEPAGSQAGFFGQITASATHEMKNHLALINEYNGLMGDFLDAHQKGHPLKLERMLSLIQQIKGQVAEGGRLLGQLNRFAHNVDPEPREIELGEELKVLVDLARRQVGLKGALLEMGPCPVPLRLTTRPFALHQALYQALLAFLAAAQRGSCLRLEGEARPQGAAVRLYWAQGAPQQAVACDISADILRDLAASLEVDEQGCLLVLSPAQA